MRAVNFLAILCGLSIRIRSVGEILADALSLYRQDVARNALVGISSTIPVGIHTYVFSAYASPLALTLVSSLASLGLANVVYVALLLHMNERLAGREPALRASLRGALRVLPSVALALALSYLLMICVTVPAITAASLLAGGVVVMSGSSPVPASALPIGVGGIVLLLSVVLFIRFIPPLMLCYPALIAEKLTGYRSIKRAFTLARKGRGRIFAVMAIASIVSLMVAAAYGVNVTGETPRFDLHGSTSGIVLFMMASGLAAPWFAAVMLLLYYDRRVRLEAPDSDAEPDAPAGRRPG